MLPFPFHDDAFDERGTGRALAGILLALADHGMRPLPLASQA